MSKTNSALNLKYSTFEDRDTLERSAQALRSCLQGNSHPGGRHRIGMADVL
jgi:hypothetical protein